MAEEVEISVENILLALILESTGKFDFDDKNENKGEKKNENNN